MKKSIEYGIITIIILSVVVIMFLHLAPVSFDALGCAGGYRRYIVDKHSEKLISLFLTEQGFSKNTNYKLVSKPEEITDTVEWNGRNINATLKIKVEDKTYNIDYSGKRYWIEKYDWKITNIKL